MTADWRVSAVCRTVDPELFFPQGESSTAVQEAQAICRTCPVIAECAREVLDMARSGVHGVWAGQYFGTTTQGRNTAHERLAAIADGATAPRRKRDDERDLRLAQIERMISWGWTTPEMAKELEVSKRQVERDRSLIRYRAGREAVAS
ncbi:WhiB family transcriptional regulator [Rhodococcoides fascians]|uniref:WhiB family transcriptional regulator n=1 Tax=Rhodococcoides fascians TaxID=1828 RepID=UPI0009B82255|nr:WhiB family transcriptional regulator [Rhodococcus fascians]